MNVFYCEVLNWIWDTLGNCRRAEITDESKYRAVLLSSFLKRLLLSLFHSSQATTYWTMLKLNFKEINFTIFKNELISPYLGIIPVSFFFQIMIIRFPNSTKCILVIKRLLCSWITIFGHHSVISPRFTFRSYLKLLYEFWALEIRKIQVQISVLKYSPRKFTNYEYIQFSYFKWLSLSFQKIKMSGYSGTPSSLNENTK